MSGRKEERYLFIEEFTGLLLDGVKILDLTGGETHDESHTFCCGRVLVEVVAGGLSPFVDSLVDGLAEVHSLLGKGRDITNRNHI